MKNLLIYLVVIFMVMGCAGVTKMTKPSDTVPAPKKFDLGEFYFKWVIMFPLEVLVGIPSGTLFMTREEIQRMNLGKERLEKKEEKGSKARDWLKN